MGTAKIHQSVGRIPAAYLAFGLIVLGVVLRVAWLLRFTRHAVSEGESANVALAFAKTGVLADAFFPGQGPTAHVTPISPLVAGLVYRLFGIQSTLSEAVLTAWSLTLVFGSFWLLYEAFGKLKSPVLARLAGLAVLCLLPLNFSLEAVWFRTWDGGLAAALGSAFLFVLLTLDQQDEVTLAQTAGTALLAALLLFVSPPLGLPAYLCGAILLVKKIPPRRWLPSLGIIAVTSVLVLAPWTIRNDLVMGKPILLRDNFGLELAQANYPAALTNPDRLAQFRQRYVEIHPYSRPAILRNNGGEVAYFDKLSRDTKQWIAQNPASFAKLTFRHLVEFFLPPSWYWQQFGGEGKGTGSKMYLNWAISIFGLCGLAYGLYRRFPDYIYLFLMTLVPVVPYIVVQPTLRYRYPILGLLVFLSADLLIRLASRIVTQRRVTAS